MAVEQIDPMEDDDRSSNDLVAYDYVYDGNPRPPRNFVKEPVVKGGPSGLRQCAGKCKEIMPLDFFPIVAEGSGYAKRCERCKANPVRPITEPQWNGSTK